MTTHIAGIDKPKIIAIVGPTASGKSALAVELARAFNGEIISADSRQVYRGLNLGTGKITRSEMRGVRHHLLDVASPTSRSPFTVAQFKNMGSAAIADILSRGKVPIICGGTGFYIHTLIDDVTLPDVPPNPPLRTKLEKKTTEELFSLLQHKDPSRAGTIDPHNKPRLIRALEIVEALGVVPRTHHTSPYNTYMIGILTDKDTLANAIEQRIDIRLKKGMIAEARRLHAQGLSWKRMHALGLEYRFLALHLQGTITRAQMHDALLTETKQYAKRQMTWFKRDKRIQWFPLTKKKALHTAVASFLSS